MKKIEDFSTSIENVSVFRTYVYSQKIKIKSDFLINKKDLIKIVSAKIRLTTINEGRAIINYSNWENIDTINTVQANEIIELDITDELQNTIDSNQCELILNSERFEEDRSKFEPSYEKEVLKFSENIVVEAEYISKTLFNKNELFKNFNIANNSNLKINLVTGNLLLTNTIGESNNMNMPFELKCSYKKSIVNNSIKYNGGTNEINHTKCGNKFGFNISQFLVENNNGNYIYLDENFDEHIFNERYYYISDNVKYYIKRDDVSVDVDGTLYYQITSNKVKRELLTDGIEFIEDLSTYNDKRHYTLPEEYANLLQEKEQYNKNIETISNNILSYKKQLYYISLNKYFEEQKTLPSTDLITQEDADKYVKKVLFPYLADTPYLDRNDFIYYSSDYYSNVNVFPDIINEYFYSFNLSEIRSSYNKEIVNYVQFHDQIMSIINSINTLNSQKINMQDKINIINAKIDDYQKLVPLYYLKIDNKYYGFAPSSKNQTGINKLYRLVLIADEFDNKIVIGYKDFDNPNIDYILTANDKYITFNYDDNDNLISIKNENESEVLFDYDILTNNLKSITYANESFVKFFYDSNQLKYVLTSQGGGIKINEEMVEVKDSNQQVIDSYLSTTLFKLNNINNIINGKITYKYDNLDEIENTHLEDLVVDDSIVEFDFYDYKCTIQKTGINENQKVKTYLFNSLGDSVCEYDGLINDNSIEGTGIVCDYKYSDNKKTLVAKAIPYSTNFLAQLEYENYLGDDLICGDEIYPSYYGTQDIRILSLSDLSNLPNTQSFSVSLDKINDINSLNYKHFVLTGWAHADSA